MCRNIWMNQFFFISMSDRVVPVVQCSRDFFQSGILYVWFVLQTVSVAYSKCARKTAHWFLWCRYMYRYFKKGNLPLFSFNSGSGIFSGKINISSWIWVFLDVLVECEKEICIGSFIHVYILSSHTEFSYFIILRNLNWYSSFKDYKLYDGLAVLSYT